VKQIVIKQKYFDTIQELIDALNSFFASKCTQKNFPDTEANHDNMGLNPILYHLDNVDPNWLVDNSIVDGAIEQLQQAIDDDAMDDERNQMLEKKLMGFYFLQRISDNFAEFNQLMQGIYSFEIYTTPSKFRGALSIFRDRPIDLSELQRPEFAEESKTHVICMDPDTVIRNNPYVTLPEVENDSLRMQNFEDLKDVEILVDKTTPVQEAFDISAVVTSSKTNQIRWSGGEFQISRQAKSDIDQLIKDLESCDTTEDLLRMFGGSSKGKEFSKTSPDDFPLIPAILARVFSNPKKFTDSGSDMERVKAYTDHYDSIMETNKGARRFGRFDLFTTFKIDKTGTIAFIKDFLNLEFAYIGKRAIANNTLLTLFNIFDSRIFYSVLYDILPSSEKKGEDSTLEGFIKVRRSSINAMSRKQNLYKDKDPAASEEGEPEEAIVEFASKTLNALGDMSHTDMAYCDAYRHMLQFECESVSSSMYSEYCTPDMVDHWIGDETFQVLQEAVNPHIPDYMKQRLGLEDDDGEGGEGGKSPSIDDLANSIDAKLAAGGDLSDKLGSGFENNNNRDSADGKIVYNVYNIRDSYNTDSSQKTVNDLSTGKTVTKTVDNSRHETTDKSSKTSGDDKMGTPNFNPQKQAKDNSNNNTSMSGIDSDESDTITMPVGESLQSGYSLNDIFMYLESDDPPVDKGNAGKPPKGTLTDAMLDADAKLLPKQQDAKRKVQAAFGAIKTAIKPCARTKQTITNGIDSIINRNEDKVKAEIIESKSYRTGLYKVMRLAVKFGLFGVAYTVAAPIGAAYLVLQGAKALDKRRLVKEVQQEMGTEMKIIDEKIERLRRQDTPDAHKKIDEAIRLKAKMQSIAIGTNQSMIALPSDPA
jgi:hypothetical protein